MAEIKLDAVELKAVVREVVGEALKELDQWQRLVNGKLALSEPEAAALLDLNPWQLRDIRLAGRIGHSRIVGNRIRYAVDDLLEYLRGGHQGGMNR